MLHDLSRPEFNPPECPEWAKETPPAWVRPFMGINALPAQWLQGEGQPLAIGTKGIDRYQANQFVWYCPETAAYLYSGHTPLQVNYRKGALPSYEELAARHTAGCRTETEKAVALLTKAIPARIRHPSAPIRGPRVPGDRNLDDESLLASGCGWCNEQARVFVRLCQVCGIQGRLIHLFGQNHTVSEFHADGRWALADATYHFVVAGRNGILLSAAACHDRGDGQRAYAAAKVARVRELLRMTDEALGFTDASEASAWRKKSEELTVEELATRVIGFGVVNNPLPR